MTDSKSVFITGSSAGFGRDVALALARRGHTVFATMRGVEGKNAGIAADFRRRAEDGGWNLHVLDVDITDEASIEAAVERAIEVAGGLDVVINNAGVGTLGLLESFPVEQLQELFDVNVFGAMRVNRAVLPHVRAKGHGHIIYISSGFGRIAVPFLGTYAGTKWALEAMAQASAYELAGEGIETTIVEPGAFGTSFKDHVIRGRDPGRLDTYGPAREKYAAMEETYTTRDRQDPQMVVEALVELVEQGRGGRPLRVLVGEDVTRALTQYNEAHAAIQAAVVAHFGMD